MSYRGTVLANTDGGAHWKVRKSGTTQSFPGVAFADSRHGSAVGDNGSILATTHGDKPRRPATDEGGAGLVSASTASGRLLYCCALES